MRPLTMRSRLKEVYAHPVGHDVLYKILLQLNIGEWVITNPLISNMRLSQFRAIAKGKVSEGFFDTLLALLNNEPDSCVAKPRHADGEIQRKWWKEAVFYQIYPKSFLDTDGDGVGDLPGILEKLDYLHDLGVDALWLSPIYASPMDDNGYDISDYCAIDPAYGTMADFEALLSGVHTRGMRLIMDLVVNHTSDEHAWFQAALRQPSSPYHDYYHFKKSEGKPPNNWVSFFSGPAWNYYEENDEWGLHLFSAKQMDLNWENAAVRQEVHAQIRWWLEKGVDGFRLDVINYISKTPELPDGDPFVGGLMQFYGIEHYFYGPKLHTYLREMREQAFEPYHAFSVGETPGVGREMSKLLTAEYRRELDMVFSFDILEMPGKARFDEYVYDLRYLKAYLSDWMRHYGENCWMSLFYDNHDNPRMLSKIDPTGQYREPLAKLLAMLQFTLCGTPFLFQGQELGAVNVAFRSMDALRDVESINLYKELLRSMPPGEAFRKVLAGTRDHARVPMQWKNAPHGGFTSGTPWISAVNDGYDAARQMEDAHSIWRFHQALIALRKRSEALRYGGVIFHKTSADLFAYTRDRIGERYTIVCNLSVRPRRQPSCTPDGVPLLCNYIGQSAILRPYEARVYRS